MFIAGFREGLASHCFAVVGAGGSSFAVASSGELDTLRCLTLVGPRSQAGPQHLVWRFAEPDVLIVRVHGGEGCG